MQLVLGLLLRDLDAAHGVEAQGLSELRASRQHGQEEAAVMRQLEAVYFLVDEAEHVVKVGRTVDTVRRLKELQTGSSKTMRFLGWIPGGARAERMLHDALADHHVRGEWYALTPEVRVLIDGACAAHRLSEDASEERDLTLALEASLAIVRRGRLATMK
jgi:hypothetical protein